MNELFIFRKEDNIDIFNSYLFFIRYNERYHIISDKVINDDNWDHRAIAEVGEAVVQTKADLEKAFPFLIESV